MAALITYTDKGGDSPQIAQIAVIQWLTYCASHKGVRDIIGELAFHVTDNIQDSAKSGVGCR